MLKINFDFPNEFCDLYNSFNNSEIGKKLLEITGIHRSQLDICTFSKNYFLSHTGDISIDANANVGNQKNPLNYICESTKSHIKLNGLYILWNYLQKITSKEEATKLIKDLIIGRYYFHDSVKWMEIYCSSVSTSHLMLSGRPYGQLHSLPPKRADSFIAQVIEYAMDLSQEQAGAVALADLVVNYAYYSYNEKLDEKRIENDFQKFVHVTNNSFRVGADSPFTNISFFDLPNLKNTFSNHIYPNGKKPIEEPYLSEIIKVQKIWMKFMSKGDPKQNGLPYRFPVSTINIYVDKNKNNEIVDKEFLDFISHLDITKFNIYITDDKAALAMCCFYKNQKVLCKNNSEVLYLTFEELEKVNKNNFRIFHNGNWVKGKLIKLPKNNKKLFKIVTVNNKEIIVTEDHINPTLNGDKYTYELTTNDYLLFNNLKLDGKVNSKLTYEQGIFIGAFLGDGYLDKYRIHLGLNEEKYKKLEKYLKIALEQWKIDAKIHLYKKDKVWNTVIYSKKLVEIVKEWVKGSKTSEKELNLNILLESYDFRKGILDGWYITDGGNRNRIYTTSKKLVESGEILITSLGLQSIINIDDRVGKIIINNKEYTKNYPVYCIRFYNPKRRSYSKIYKIKNNSIYFKIKSIEEFPNNEKWVYCFQMDNEEEPYFTLPNGIITHNCRFTNKVDDFIKMRFDSFGNGGVNIGSCRVNTINLPRIAFEVNGNLEEAKKILLKRIDGCCKILVAHRLFIKKKIEEGFLKFFNPLKWLDLD
ncbi:MAG TPA: hypothetical protein ENG63_00855, partial [Candidatus Desulfofervidus auxilii]|nr:hypothetical protein [Candidatus Desulfofervidus auxilii]